MGTSPVFSGTGGVVPELAEEFHGSCTTVLGTLDAGVRRVLGMQLAPEP